MGLSEALFEYLSDDAGVSALVSDRIYPTRLPEGTNASPLPLPAISYQRIDTPRVYTYDAFEDTRAWATARVQFSCWSNTPLQAEQVGEAVLLALSGYNGQMAGKSIGSSFAVLELDDYDAPVKLFRRIIDFQISFEDEPATS